MEKRNRKAIEADVKLIQAASATAKSIKEISEMTGISVRKIGTSLKSHPIIKKRVIEAVEKNRIGTAEVGVMKKPPKTTRVKAKVKKEVTICDAPALVSGLSSCLTSPITIPHYVFNTLVGLAKGTGTEHVKAQRALAAISTTPKWCTVAEKVMDESILVDPDGEEPNWRARALVSLACKYWSDGYSVTIKTRTGSIDALARLQGVFEVCFVEADND